MILSSTPPTRTDAGPWVDGHGRRWETPFESDGHCPDCTTTYAPVFQHRAHPANPILVKLRDEGYPLRHRITGYVVHGEHPTIIEHYLSQLERAEEHPSLTWIGLGVVATAEHVNHARRVLTKLALLNEGAAS